MKKLALLLGLLFVTPAFAADNAVIVTPGTGVTMKSKDIGSGVQAMQPILSDTGGNALSTPTAGADGVSNTSTGLLDYSRMLQFNGTTWDRWQGAISIASGKVASGAYASGALAVGAGTDGWDATQGAKADAKNAATDTTPITIMSVLKQISASIQAAAASLVTAVNSLATIATNTGAAIPTQSVTIPIGGVTNDPCQYATKTNAAIATSSGTVQLVAPSGSTQVYVCSFSLIAASTAVVNLVGGTGATCTTGTPVAALGSTTAASGMSLAANGGLTYGNGGATAARTTTAGHGLCLIQSGTTALAGNITFVQQ